MSTPRYCAAIVDLDGTMVDTLGDFVAALNAMLRDLQLRPATAAQVRDRVGKGSEHLIRSVLALQCDLRTAEALYDHAWRHYQAHYRALNGWHSTLYPGVSQGLQRLRDHGLRLACLTNKPTEFAQALLQRMGLAPQFEVVFGGDAFERRKSDPLPVRKTCEALRLPPHAVLVIGDSRNDAEAARAAGCDVALVPYGYNHGEPIDAVPCTWRADTLEAIAAQIKARF